MIERSPALLGRQGSRADHGVSHPILFTAIPAADSRYSLAVKILEQMPVKEIKLKHSRSKSNKTL